MLDDIQICVICNNSSPMAEKTHKHAPTGVAVFCCWECRNFRANEIKCNKYVLIDNENSDTEPPDTDKSIQCHTNKHYSMSYSTAGGIINDSDYIDPWDNDP